METELEITEWQTSLRYAEKVVVKGIGPNNSLSNAYLYIKGDSGHIYEWDINHLSQRDFDLLESKLSSKE